MWDWSGSKAPPPVRSGGEAAQEAQRQGVTPLRRDFRDTPVYREPRMYRPMPQTAPASAYPDPFDLPNSPYVNAPPIYPQPHAQPHGQPQPQQPMRPPHAPPVYSNGQPQNQMPYPPQPYGQPASVPPYSPQPYMPQPQAPQPYPQRPYGQTPPQMQQPYSAQPYMPQQPAAPHYPAYNQAPQPYMPQPVAQPYEQPYAQGYGQRPPSAPYMPQPSQPYEQSYASQGYGQSFVQPQARESVESSKDLWDWEFQQVGFLNMDLVEADFVMLEPNWLLELRKAFKRTRRDFLKYVGYHHVNELLMAGMDENAIKLVKKGRAPENFNVHVRIPFDYGGTNSFSNLVLIQTHPFHSEIHKFIDKQVLSQPNFKPQKLYIPSPKGKVYFSGEVEVSTGGTSRHDRSVYAGFLESTFEMIAQKSSLGR